MRMTSKLIVAGVFVAAISSCAYAANTWYVDDDNYSEECGDSATAYIAAGFDGTTPAKAFGTIQTAISYSGCVAGDTIKVMPGIYDKGYYTETINSTYECRSRVYVSKKVYIEAVGTKDETHIVGRWMPTSEGGNATFHTGTNAIRCVRVKAGVTGASLTGFTLRDGATRGNSTTAGGYCGGAVSAGNASDNKKPNREFYVVDCVISNSCCNRYAGAGYGGTYIRCRIHNVLGGQGCAALSYANAINCVFTKCEFNGSYYTLALNCNLVNCTIFGSKSAAPDANSKTYNCIFLSNHSDSAENNGTGASNVYASASASYKNASSEQLFAPVFDDFHPLTGSFTTTAGGTEFLTTNCPFALPAALADEKYFDFEGTRIDTNGTTVAAGAIQTPKTPQYGGILTTGGVTINGVGTYNENVFFADKWPMSVRATRTCHRLSVTGKMLSGAHDIFMNKSNQTWLCPPYEAGSIKTNTYVAINTSYYVNQATGSDETGTGASDKPYATIQAAVAKARAGSSASTGYVIYVAEGDYNTGGGVYRGVTNRVDVAGTARWIKFVATGDRDKTIIRGKAATNERDPVNHPGCGPDAVRCVNTAYNTASANHSIAFVNFTFADGHTDVGQNADNDMGGAGFGRNSHYDALQFIDCVFTNCYAPAAGVAKQAHFTRCRFVDCGGSTDGFRNAYLSSCAVEKGTFGTGVLGASTHVVGTSIANDNAVAPGAAPTLINSLLGDGGTVPSSVARLWGSTANSCFADAENGDLRPVAGSPALDESVRVFPEPGDSDWNTFSLYLADLVTLSVDGKTWVFGDKYPIAGAYMGWVPGVSVVADTSVDSSIYEVSGARLGGTPLDAGESVTVSVSRNPSATRHYGIVANGVTNMLDSGAGVYVVPASEGMTGGSLRLSGIVDQNWYVNADPEVGSNLNNGFTPSTPKLTLRGVLAVATNAGDVVHAAAGTYSQDAMTNSTYGVARAAIRSDITLVADEGPEHTTIEGAAGPNGSYKQGGSAMRCVMLGKNSTVKGFTLRNGHSSEEGSSSGIGVKYCGGGAWANYESSGTLATARVIDCVITGCAAYGGGAAFGCSLFGTEIRGNKSKYGAATRCSLYGCLVGENDYASAGLYQCYDIYDTTVEAGADGASCVALMDSITVLCNSLVLGNATGTKAPYNTIFCGTYDATLAANAVDCVFTNKASLGLNDYRPSARGAACETGDGSLLPSDQTNAKLLREMREARPIMNGAMDAGCYEADWRGAYASDIARSRITVVSASTNVVETEDRHVRINPGQSLAATWNCGAGARMNYDLNFRVVGTGALSVSVNGVDSTYDTEGDYTIRLDGALADASMSFAYSGEGYAEILSGRGNDGMIMLVK